MIGRVYEYFLQIYATSGTKEEGAFYTPASIVKLIAEMIEPYSGVVYDSCCESRVIIMTTACNNDKIRLSSPLQKNK